MQECLIDVQTVDKVYRIWGRPHARLTGSLAGRLSRLPWLPPLLRKGAQSYSEQVYTEFFALRDITLTVGKGESVGIIGRNGSGKSTLLKLIAGTLQPSRGDIRIRGRVAAMLELAAGFEQEFTGRENVFLSAAILGLSENETLDRFEQIEAFADIGPFMSQPVKTYSSGMLLRLAFAVHTAVEPEILIIDEALAVGDETFRRKCYARLDWLRERGTTLLFVSHDLGSVANLTDRALFLHEGELVLEGAPQEVVKEYQRYSHLTREEAHGFVNVLKSGRKSRDLPAKAVEDKGSGGEAREEDPAADYDPNFKSQSRVEYPRHGGEIFALKVTTPEGRQVNQLQRRKTYVFEYKVRFSETCADVSFSMLIKSFKGLELGGSRTLPWDTFIPEVKAGSVYAIRFEFQTLVMPGVYFFNAGVEGLKEGERSYIHRIVDAIPFRVLREAHLFPTGSVDFLVEPSMQLIEDRRS
jgi:lipopolysaccharide transport system ATP-binding protein